MTPPRVGIAKIADDAARRDVMIACLAGGILTALRLFILIGLLRVISVTDTQTFVEVVVETVVFGALTFGLYRRSVGAAISLLVVFSVLYIVTWVDSGGVIPPVGLIGLAAWYCFYRGVSGTRDLAAASARSVSKA